MVRVVRSPQLPFTRAQATDGSRGTHQGGASVVGIAVAAAEEIEHDLAAIVELQAEPVPPAPALAELVGA